MMGNNRMKHFLRNLIAVCLILSSVFAFSIFFLNGNSTKSALATENVGSKERLKVYAGGENIGIKISTKGVLAVAFSDIESMEGKVVKSPAELSNINLGDVILKINGKEISTSKELLGVVGESKTGIVELTIDRNGNVINKKVNLIKNKKGDYKLGLWVRDSTAGIGTMTFFDDKTGVYGGLGHPITDSETEKIISVGDGKLVKSTVVNVRKGEVGSPGELKGIFNNDRVALGTVGKNTSTGIYGVVNEKNASQYKSDDRFYEVAFKEEIKVGPAKIITTIDEGGPRYYDISIEKILDTVKGPNKNMLIKVTDPELLAKTGGIVQGMSGSPIIQDGKIVGAVTHVLVNRPNIGYGIYIENMLKDANLLK
ncbi:MAG: SpoIVB peptidase [Sarcina sp.]